MALSWPDRPPRVFIGLTDVASQLADLRRGFQALGCSVFSAARRTSARINSFDIDVDVGDLDGVTATLPRWLRDSVFRGYRAGPGRLMRRVAPHIDVFIFMSSSFSPDRRDLATLRAMGKKTAVFFVGSDVLWKPAADQEFDSLGLDRLRYPDSYVTRYDRPAELWRKLRSLRGAERYATLLTTAPALSQLMVRPYLRGRHMVPLDAIRFLPAPRARRPLVLHAPTSPVYKGTAFVEEAVAQLRAEGVVFDYRSFTDLPNHEALALYSDADILVGELFYPGGGKQQREALAAGTVVLTNHDPRYPKALPGMPPFVHVTKDSLAAELRRVIGDHALRERLAHEGRRYVEAEQRPEQFARDLLDHLYGVRHELLTPRFFRENFVPERPAFAMIHNAWLRFVAREPWYRAAVPPGAREGLLF